ncbi:armadillo repeat-containing protein 6 [Cucurbita pepo subsp. pepo]|uniref:armadillo repeat-containing protein 6 n=1 Tax=Cucurbita pepo subsp. pepo TaxID=3664 RepID=UPI000C9DA3F8|nr:armadillo repeat-containing protein 6 [Cucurbita pepo subsp. pepo]
MGPPKTLRGISQEAFDEVVRENVEDLGMDPTEALQDAIETLTLQGVDLSGIVRCVPGEGSVNDNPLVQSLERLKQLDGDSKDRISDEYLDEMVDLFDRISELCGSNEESGNVSIVLRNGGLELLCSLCCKIPSECRRAVASALKTMVLLLQDLHSTEIFRNSNGPKIVMDVLNNGKENVDILHGGFAVVAAAATANEVLKEIFMEMNIDELILQTLSTHRGDCISSLYDAIRVLLTPDDNRVVASQVYGYARRFAKIGIANALVDSLHGGLNSAGLVSASIALKAVAVNDEICKSIAENGGIDAVLRCIDDSGDQGNKMVAKVCCSLLSKLAGSDANKSAIIEKKGLDKLIKLSSRFSDDPSVLQEVMSIISVLTLRSPENATRAIEAGAGDLAIQAMQKFPSAQQMQRNSCHMIRNLVVRNPENRALLLKNGIEKYIRKAKQNHESCKDAASDALRDLGLDNYL